MTRSACKWLGLVVVVALVTAACGGAESPSDAGEGEERKVLVDYRHDEFTSAFLRYYPANVKVRPGDTVTFEQIWTGEPHSVTMGKVVDNYIEFVPLLEKYQSPEEALAGGETQETVDEVLETVTKLPGMHKNGTDFGVYQPGAQPCYVDDFDGVPAFNSPMGEQLDGVECPTKGGPQPKFDGRQGLYNSGFIPPEGKGANAFQVPIATDADPGTYTYFCNYHWFQMSGTVEIVGAEETVPTQQQVSRQGRREIERDAESALERVREAKEAKQRVDDLELPLAGRAVDDESPVIINEFLPNTATARVGEKVTWTFDGIDHTVSFNVPKYFPIFTIEKDGEVVWDERSYEPIGWDVPPEPEPQEGEGPPEGEEVGHEPRFIDVGAWDGKGGFHSSGSLSPGDTFSVTFTKSGTYSYACVLHPQMVGTLVVKS